GYDDARAGPVQRSDEAEVLLVGRDHLVVGREPEARKDGHAATTRRLDERDRAWSDVEHSREPRARLVAQRDHPLVVRGPSPPALEVGARLLDDSLRGRPCERAVRARVQIREALEHRELRPRFLEVHPTVASTGAWSERSFPSMRRRSAGQATGGVDGRPRTRIWSMLAASGSDQPSSSYGGRRLASPARTAGPSPASPTTVRNCSSAGSPPVTWKSPTNVPSSSVMPRSTRFGPTFSRRSPAIASDGDKRIASASPVTAE